MIKSGIKMLSVGALSLVLLGCEDEAKKTAKDLEGSHAPKVQAQNKEKSVEKTVSTLTQDAKAAMEQAKAELDQAQLELNKITETYSALLSDDRSSDALYFKNLAQDLFSQLKRAKEGELRLKKDKFMALNVCHVEKCSIKEESSQGVDASKREEEGKFLYSQFLEKQRSAIEALSSIEGLTNESEIFGKVDRAKKFLEQAQEMIGYSDLVNTYTVEVTPNTQE